MDYLFDWFGRLVELFPAHGLFGLIGLQDVLSCFQHMEYLFDWFGRLVELFPAHGLFV